jgi:hypothetical protein
VKTLAAAVVSCFIVTTAFAQAAPGPFAALSMGQRVTYKSITSSQNGAEQAAHTIELTRTGAASINVSLDGAAAVVTTANTDGSISTTPAVQSAIAPLLQLAAVMRGSPARLSSGATWTATLPVPIKDTTVRIPLTVTVLHADETSATIAANGTTQTTIHHGIRSIPATVTARYSFVRNGHGVVTNGNGALVVTVERAFRDEAVNNSWSLAIAR